MYDMLDVDHRADMEVQAIPKEYSVGLTAVRMAATLCETVRKEMVVGSAPDKLDKHDHSPVTVADFGTQAIICHQLGEAFPDDIIIAEEDSAALRDPVNARQLAAVERVIRAQVGAVDQATICGWIDRGNGVAGERFWVLDPIDGTKGFLRYEQYAIALALIEGDEVQWGFLACPALPHHSGVGIVFVARRGGGTTMVSLDGMELGRAEVSAVTDPAQARLAESVESAHTNRGLSSQLRDALGIVAAPVHLDSQAKYALVAAGSAEIYLRAPNPRTPTYRECVWDHAAGWLVVTEAGGKVSDIYGQPLCWTHGRRLEQNSGVVVTNGHLHEVVIREIAALAPPSVER